MAVWMKTSWMTLSNDPAAFSNDGYTGARCSRAPETFRARKAKAQSRTLRLQSCFIHIFLIWGEVNFIQEVSGVYTSPFLHTDERKMALRAPGLSRNRPQVRMLAIGNRAIRGEWLWTPTSSLLHVFFFRCLGRLESAQNAIVVYFWLTN